MPLSRRDLLRIVGAGFVGASCGRPAESRDGEAASAAADPSARGAAAPTPPDDAAPGRTPGQEGLHTVTIPSSGERVPAVGIGTRDYRADVARGDLSRFRETLRAYHAHGGRVVDTAPAYGNAEEVLGHLLAELGIRDDMWIATKVDRSGRARGEERMERSLGLLGGAVDLMQVHNLRDAETQLATMKAWRDAGRFRYVGITTSSDRQYEPFARLMRQHDLDFVQVDYGLDNRTAARTILPLARDRGMAVLVNLPFGRGRLFEAVGDRALPDWAAEIGAESWAQVFLKYVMGAPGAVIPIPGTTRPQHAVSNIGAARGGIPDAALRREIEAWFDALV